MAFRVCYQERQNTQEDSLSALVSLGESGRYWSTRCGKWLVCSNIHYNEVGCKELY